MDSSSDHYSDRLFGRQISVHQILGGGLAADIILWRRKSLTLGILSVTLAVWLVFERSGYTLLSLISSVLLLLMSILYLWATSATILNRPAPPLPELYLSEEMVKEIGALLHTHVNHFLRLSQDIALGKNSKLFFKVAASLLLISFVAGLTDFLTLGYTSLVIILTIPAIYERYEEYIDKYVLMGYRNLCHMYVKLDVELLSKIRSWVLEQKKLS
ncbi:hypothetical protein ACFE04_003714 [Oxalis oulophora]